jgi:hypothetical protein
MGSSNWQSQNLNAEERRRRRRNKLRAIAEAKLHYAALRTTSKKLLNYAIFGSFGVLAISSPSLLPFLCVSKV